MTESLFNEYEAMNDAGKSFADKIETAITPIIQEFGMTYSHRELLSIITVVAVNIISEKTLRYAAALRKLQKEL